MGRSRLLWLGEWSLRILAFPNYETMTLRVCARNLGGRLGVMGTCPSPLIFDLEFSHADMRDRFGAVLEEFEVRDALESIFYTKPDLNMAY